MYVYISQHNLKRIASSQTRTTLFFKNMKQFCHNHKDSHWRNESDEYS